MEQFLAEHDSGKKNTDTEAETKESVLQEAGSTDGNYTFASVAAPEYTQEKNTAKRQIADGLGRHGETGAALVQPRFDYMAYHLPERAAGIPLPAPLFRPPPLPNRRLHHGPAYGRP